jgi:ribosome biogenesis protein MAK21
MDALIDRISPALFTIAHSPNLSGALQAMMLLFQLLSARSSVSDRYYRALYALLLHPGLLRSANNAQVLSLIFKSLREDVVPKRSAAMVKRLLQVASQAPATFACGALMAVSEFLSKQPSHWNAIRVPRETEEDGVEHFSDVRDDEDETNEGTGLFEGDKTTERTPKATKSDSEKSSDDDEDADQANAVDGEKGSNRVGGPSERYDMEKR